jgi:hypothetical protein
LSGWFDVRKRLSGWKLLFDTIYEDDVFCWVLVSSWIDGSDSLSIDTGKRTKMGQPGRRLYYGSVYDIWVDILYRWCRNGMCCSLYRRGIRVSGVYT